jgi:phosphocarrier protein HPr
VLRQKITIINRLGLHARASLQLINRAGRYQSQIDILYKEQKIDAKDILNVMSLAVTCGNDIELEISGPDEIEAMADLVALINARFGEEE